MWGHFPFESHGRDEHHAPSVVGEFSDELLIRCDELRELLDASEGLHLPELRDDDGGSGIAELLAPVALLPPTVGTGLGLDAALGFAASGIEVVQAAAVAPLFEDGVTFPAEVADFDVQFRLRCDEIRLKQAVEACPLDVRAACEGDDIIGFEFKGLSTSRNGGKGQKCKNGKSHG